MNEAPSPRQRLSREQRYRQLIAVSWQVVREEGTDALTLGRLSEAAGVTKPVVYDHFGTREGLLAALYREFDARQTVAMEAALASAPADLAHKAGVIAACWVDCVLLQGREIPGILAALAGSPELEKTRRDYQMAFLEKCRCILAPFTRGASISQAGLWGMLGAADTLSDAAARGDISAEEARQELAAIITGLVARSGGAGPRISSLA